MADRQLWKEVNGVDGGILEVLIDAGASGRPLVFHHGTPGTAIWYGRLADAARDVGLQLVAYTRPGYAGSTARRHRSVADAAVDVAAILDALGAADFVSLGWSGGGPHSLACAALLPGRCIAAAIIAGVAPYRAHGLDWMAGMGKENVEEFSAALQGEDVLRPALERYARELVTVQAADVAAALGGLVSEVDKRALTGEFAEVLALSFRRAVSRGIDGWLDDDLAFTRDWGFALDEIRAPVAIWQGEQDRMVPFSHGQWLASHVRGAQAHLFPDEGHLSLAVGAIDRILADLAALGQEVTPARA